MHLVFDANDVSAIDAYTEWQEATWPTPMFPMDEPIGFAGPLPDQRDKEKDKAEDTRVRTIELFVDVTDEDYDEAANSDYNG